MFTPHRPSLDLTVYQSMRVHGDLTVYLTWYGPAADDSEPCIAIVPSFRSRASGFAPAVIALSAAYKWEHPSRELAHTVAFLLDGLGMEPTSSNGRRLLDLVHHHLDDLIKMPPMPTRQMMVIGEVKAVSSEEQVIETEIVRRL